MFENIRYILNNQKCRDYAQLYLEAKDKDNPKTRFFLAMAIKYGGQAVLLSEKSKRIKQKDIESTKRLYSGLLGVLAADKLVKATSFKKNLEKKTNNP